MANLQYIGARYVPKFYLNPDDQSNNWKADVDYEALMIVTYNNDSYTSKVPVPKNIGNPADNPLYWACTTKYTAAIMALQTTVANQGVAIDELILKDAEFAQYISYVLTDCAYFDTVRRVGTKHYYNDGSVGPAVYGSHQGLCKAINTYLTMLIPIERYYNATDITNLAVIVEMDSQFHEIRRSTPIKLYHGRNMIYHNNRIYVYANSEGTTSTVVNKIVIVNYDDLSIITEIDLPDYNGGCFLFIKDDYLYTGSPTHIEKRTLDGSVIEHTDLTDKNLPAFHSVKPYRNGYVGTVNSPNGIYILDDKYNIVKILNVQPDMLYDGELKDIAVDNDDIYVAQNGRTYVRLTTAEYTEVYANIFKFNPYKNVLESADRYKLSDTYSKQPRAVVNAATTDSNQNGTEDHPFATVMMAIHYGFKEILCNDSEVTEYVLTGANMDVWIRGQDKTKTIILVDTLLHCTLSGHTFTFEHGLRDNNLTDSILNLYDITYNVGVYARNCILNCDISTNVYENETDTNMLLYMSGSPKSSNQKYRIAANSDRIALPFDGLSSKGIYMFRTRANYGGHAFVFKGWSYGNGDFTTPYYSCTEYGSALHELVLRLEFTVNSDNEFVVTATFGYLDGVAIDVTDVTFDRIALVHII